MGRASRRRRHGDAHLTSVTLFPGEDSARQRQDFLAGTVFAAGAGMFAPPGPAGGIDEDETPVFTVFLHEDESTFGPAPVLREVLALHDELGTLALNERLVVGASWGVLMASDPLAKLKLEFHEPLQGRCEIVLLAANYAGIWHAIAEGGMVGLTALERLQAAVDRPDATFADGLDAVIPIGLAGSPALRHLIRTHGWPG